MVSTVDKDLFRGNSLTMDIVVTATQATPQSPVVFVDLTGALIVFTMKLWRADGKSVHADAPVVRKTSDNTAEIEILPQSGATIGLATLYLLPEDTKWLEPGTYVYDVQVKIGGEVFTLQMGRIYLAGGVGSAEDTSTP